MKARELPLRTALFPAVLPAAGVCARAQVQAQAQVKESERTGIALPATYSPQFAPVAEPAIRTGVVAMTALAVSLSNDELARP